MTPEGCGTSVHLKRRDAAPGLPIDCSFPRPIFSSNNSAAYPRTHFLLILRFGIILSSLSKLLGLLGRVWVIGHILKEGYIQCLHSNLISSFVVVGLLLGVHSEQRESMFTWRSFLNKISGHPRTPAHAPAPGAMDLDVKVSFL